MISLQTKKRMSLGFAVIGIGLMGVDLMITRNFFIHSAELMVASIACLLLALVCDRARTQEPQPKKS